MDKASGYGPEDCGFKSHRLCFFLHPTITNNLKSNPQKSRYIYKKFGVQAYGKDIVYFNWSINKLIKRNGLKLKEVLEHL